MMKNVFNPYLRHVVMIFILLQLAFPASALDGYAQIVSNVKGLQDYELHWNDKFPPGSNLKIYAEASEINHKRYVGVDYVFIIRDSNNNKVDIKSFSNRYEDYRENDLITYSIIVPEKWDDGVYKAYIYIFDLLDDNIMEEYQNNITISMLNDSSLPDIPYLERGEILLMNGTEKQKHYKAIEKEFYIDKYANKYPMDRFRVENMKLDKTILAPGEPMQVSVNVSNIFYEKGSTSLDLILDNKLVDSAKVEVNESGSARVNFTLSTEHVGHHTVEIIPSGKNTIALKTIAFFEVSPLKKVDTPTNFVYREITTDKIKVDPSLKVNISIIVENKGGEGSQPIGLYINDVLEEERQVHLKNSEIKEIIFEVEKQDAGAYRVTTGQSNLSKVFFVGTPVTTPEAIAGQETRKENKPKAAIILGLSILVICTHILRKYLKKRYK